MQKLTQYELDLIIEHSPQPLNLSQMNLFCLGMIGANMHGADMRDANISGANLWGTAGNGIELKSMQIFKEYDICYSTHALYIGCEGHTIDDWGKFSDHDIRVMDGQKAVDFWHKNKGSILDTVKSFPAE